MNAPTAKIPTPQPRETTYTYEAFGLGIHSNFPLPELLPFQSNRDVMIHFENPAEVPPQAKGVSNWFHATDGEIVLAWENVGTFRILGGSQIQIVPAPGASDETVRLFLLGIVLSTLLHQRGLPVFHASAVSNNRQGYMFVGAHGAGKSTLASALHARGFDFLSDDTVALDFRSIEPLILPGFPRGKLWPDSIEKGLRRTSNDFAVLTEGTQKRSIPIRDRFSKEPVSLGCVFILDQDSEPRIEKLSPQQAILKLLPHSCAAWALCDVLHLFGLSRPLFYCGRIVNWAPVCLLKIPRDLGRLQDVGQVIEAYQREFLQ